MIRILTFLLFAASLHAETIHVAQTAAGGDTGADAANAHAMTWFNTAGNWGGGAGEIDPGDTVVFNGTITSTATVQASGSSGNVITLLFATGAKFSKNYWGQGSSAAIYAASKSYITIDGGTNGIIETTANGTLLANQQNGTGIDFSGANYLVIQNLHIGPMYLRDPGSITDFNRYGYAMNLSGSNSTVQDNVMVDGAELFNLNYVTGSQSNWLIQRNDVSRCNHGFTMATSSGTPGSLITDVSFLNNTVYDLDVWESSGDTGIHLDGFIIFDEDTSNTSNCTRLTLAGNTIGPGIGVTNTAGIFIIMNEARDFTDTRIYNNVFITDDGKYWTNGCISLGYGEGSKILNNTFIHLGADSEGRAMQCTGDDVVIRNNLTWRFNTAFSMLSRTALEGWPSSAVMDNNVYYSLSPGSEAFYGPTTVGGPHTVTDWLALTAPKDYDEASEFASQPTLDGSYIPTAADTVAKDTGVDLSATYPWLATDKAGVTRSQWYAGAYEYNGTGGTITTGSLSVGGTLSIGN